MKEENINGVIWLNSRFLPLKRAFFNAVAFGVNRQLIKSAARGHTASVYKWISRGADVSSEALDVARRNGHRNTVALLESYGADPEKVKERYQRMIFTEKEMANDPSIRSFATRADGCTMSYKGDSFAFNGVCRPQIVIDRKRGDGPAICCGTHMHL